MSTERPPMVHQYRTAIIGLAIAAGLLVLKQGIDLIAGSVSSLIASSFAYSLALAANFLALVAAVCGVGRTRRAGIGFSLCGWGYLIFASFEHGPFHAKPPLLTSLAFELVFGLNSMGNRGGGPESMIWAAHSIAAVAAGLGGAWFASRLPHPETDTAPITPLLELVRSFRPARAERPVITAVAPVHPLDRTD